MIIGGLTDSLATVHAAARECPHCHGTSRIAHGLCLSCLLLAGADEDEDLAAGEFDAVLAALPVPDIQWRLGNYEILEEIGRGGMGVIYRARQRHSRRIVALKRVLSYHADSRETLARFRREAQAAASLDHPNILPIYEVGESEEGVPFFSMKYASGGSLQEIGPALRDDPRQIVRLIAKVTRAVQYAHRQGILHRDLKPGNILLDGRGEALVSDFGLAKWLDTSSDLTRTLTIFGTPGYIAPEQAEGPSTNVKPAADVYSLGAILFDLLTGRPPFLGEHALAVIRQAADNTAPKLRSLVRGADRDLETICARCLEREPAARYRSAGDLAEDFERWLEGRSIIARPVSLPLCVWRWSKRNPVLSASFVIGALLAGFGLVRQLESNRLARTVREEELATHSIAILPILNLETAQEDGSLAKALEGPLQKAMTPLGSAKIQTMTDGTAAKLGFGTIDDLREVGRKASARTALTGTVRENGKGRRLSLRLKDVKTGETLWVQMLDSKTPALDLGTVGMFANGLFAALNGAPQVARTATDPVTHDPAASEFLRAGEELMNHRTLADVDLAIGCYRKAIELQPRSSLAHAAFVGACLQKMDFGTADSALMEEVERRAREAVELDPASSQTHRALAHLSFQQGHLGQAREEVLQAIEAGAFGEASSSMAMIEKMRGRPDLALRWSAISSRWRARPADDEYIPGDCLADLAADTEAGSFYRRVSALHPEIPEGWMGLCRLKMLEGEFVAARDLYRENIERSHDSSFPRQLAAQVEFFARDFSAAEKLYAGLAAENADGGGSFYGCVSFSSALGFLQRLAGNESGGRALLTESLTKEEKALQRSPGHPEILYRVAALESCLGHTEASLQHLAAAARAGWLDYRSLNFDPRFDAIRTSVQYQKITQEMVARVALLRRSQTMGHG